MSTFLFRIIFCLLTTLYRSSLPCSLLCSLQGSVMNSNAIFQALVLQEMAFFLLLLPPSCSFGLLPCSISICLHVVIRSMMIICLVLIMAPSFYIYSILVQACRSRQNMYANMRLFLYFYNPSSPLHIVH